MLTLSPAFNEQTPGLTRINLRFFASQGGVAIRTFNIIIFPSAGWFAIE